MRKEEEESEDDRVRVQETIDHSKSKRDSNGENQG